MPEANVPMMGFEGRAYIGAAGGAASAELKNVRSLKIGVTYAEVDSTVQGNHGVTSTSKGQKSFVLGFDKVVTSNPDAADILANNAIFSRDPVTLHFVESSSGSGPSGTFHIFGGEQTMDGDGVQVIPCTAKPATGYDPPENAAHGTPVSND